MRLCVVHINAEKVSGPYTGRVIAMFDHLKRPDTIIEHRYVRSKRATDAVFAFQFLLNKFDVAQHFIAADRAGYDGAMVACTGDPGVVEGRSLVSIPIVGPFEAALHHACMYGLKVGIVTVADRSWWEAVHTLVDTAGLTNRVSGIGQIKTDSLQAFSTGFDDPFPIAADVEKQARALVEKGANSIVLASAGLSTIASAAGLSSIKDLGVPIFDSLAVGLKTLEMRVELAKLAAIPVSSRVGLTQQLASADIDRLAKLYEFSDRLN
jgi:allantoin racemase